MTYRELLKKALEALETCDIIFDGNKQVFNCDLVKLVKIEIESALSKPEPVPFGWYFHGDKPPFFMKNKRDIMAGPTDEWEQKYKDKITPLYINTCQESSDEIESLRLFIEKWIYDSNLQTYENREIFRKEAKELLGINNEN